MKYIVSTAEELTAKLEKQSIFINTIDGVQMCIIKYQIRSTDNKCYSNSEYGKPKKAQVGQGSSWEETHKFGIKRRLLRMV